MALDHITRLRSVSRANVLTRTKILPDVSCDDAQFCGLLNRTGRQCRDSAIFFIVEAFLRGRRSFCFTDVKMQTHVVSTRKLFSDIAI